MNLSENVKLTPDVCLKVMWKGDHLLVLPVPVASVETPAAIKASETDMVELGLALHAAGVFPGLTQEAVMERMRRLSGFSLEHWEQLGANIRRRDSLKFLDRLQNSLDDRNEEIKEHGRVNRRPKPPQK